MAIIAYDHLFLSEYIDTDIEEEYICEAFYTNLEYSMLEIYICYDDGITAIINGLFLSLYYMDNIYDNNDLIYYLQHAITAKANYINSLFIFYAKLCHQMTMMKINKTFTYSEYLELKDREYEWFHINTMIKRYGHMHCVCVMTAHQILIVIVYIADHSNGKYIIMGLILHFITIGLEQIYLIMIWILFRYGCSRKIYNLIFF